MFLLDVVFPAAPTLDGYCGPYEFGMKQSMMNDPKFSYID